MDIVKHPWEAVCPACRKMLPGFDAKSFYFSGRDEWGRFRWDRADQSLLPKDEKFRETALDAFKAYCRNYWSTGFQDAVEALADAFVFTGKKVYARYTIGLLVHFAYFYPYFLQKDCVSGDTHPGAMLMDCHESMFMKCMALVYDKIFTAIPEPGMIRVADRMVRPYGTRLSTADEVKAFLEGRVFKIIAGDMKRIWFLDGGITRYRDHVAYETIGMVLGKTPLGRKFQHEAWTLRFQGFEKDGSADVGGLGYDRGAYHRVIGQYFDLMKYCKDARVDYARDSSVQAASHFYFDLYCLDRYFPNYGDARFCSSPARLRPTEQSVPDRRGMSEDMRKAACEYAEFFRATGIKRFARIAWHLNGKKTDGIHLGILDRDPEKIQAAIQKISDKADAPLEKSIIARDLGMCVLKSGEGKNRRALWMRANRRNQIHEGGWHGHADSLNLGLFAFGLDIMPDVGFMDQKHWVFGHNTVSRQETPLPHTGQRLPPGWTDTALPLPILSEAAFIADLGGGVQVARCVGTQHPGSMRT
ncbi:MAG: hypothetical protein QF662_06590, partial [Phycisphaerae bacterium]|nr:hypothetical protein [Phycisphaerae bacterium]